ncbi:MAG: hypothetical protein ABSH34_16170 [Verrucomicrobiota bacterium]
MATWMTVWVCGVTSPVSGLVTCGVNCRVVEQPSRAVTGQVSGSGIVPPPCGRWDRLRAWIGWSDLRLGGAE